MVWHNGCLIYNERNEKAACYAGSLFNGHERRGIIDRSKGAPKPEVERLRS